MSDADGQRWFVLWAEDPDYACPCLEQCFVVDDVEALRKIVAPDEGDDIDLGGSIFWLDAEQLRAAHDVFGVGAEFFDYENVAISGWCGFLRTVPYLVHTNFELFLMLDGRKQLAAFSEFAPSDWLDESLLAFDSHVATGRLVRRVVETPLAKPVRGRDGQVYDRRRQVLFSRPGQEWRIDAYLAMERVSEKTGWNETLETLEGSLYGYEDWQIDWWLAEHRRRKADRNFSLPPSAYLKAHKGVVMPARQRRYPRISEASCSTTKSWMPETSSGMTAEAPPNPVIRDRHHASGRRPGSGRVAPDYCLRGS